MQNKQEGHPAKRTFQAIRIEVNNEIKPLYNTVIKCINCLKEGGRLCIITFHSLEDRAVKKAYSRFRSENVLVQKIYHIVYVMKKNLEKL